MKGLVLAGGNGTRLRPITYSGAKQLVPVANKPILFYVIENLVNAGVRDIGVIISPQTGAEIKEALGDGARFGAQFTFILQEKPLGLAHAVLTAKVFIGESDFVMYLGDNLIGSPIGDMVQRFERGDGYATLLLKDVPDPRQFGVAKFDERGMVAGVIEKPTSPPSTSALVGVYFFRAAVVEVCGTLRPSARGELEITDAINAMLDDSCGVYFERLESWWLDTGKKDDLLAANATVLDEWLEPARAGLVIDSRVSGRVRIEPGATVKRTTVIGPTVIGAGALIQDAFVGPYTSIAEDVMIQRARIDNSVVLRGATVSGVRVADSLIGKRVVIRRKQDALSPAMITVGDDCVVELESVT